MKQKTARKIGFFSALSICFSSVVGIGIFLKNASVGRNLEGNGISWLITWVIAGLTATLLAFHFGKISRLSSDNGTTGLNAWTQKIASSKNSWFRKLVSLNYGLFYNPILTICISFFCAELLISFVKTINKNVELDYWVYIVISLCFLSFFIINNYVSYRFSGYISLSTSILKFIPLIMVIFIGIIFANQHNYEGDITSNGFENSISFEKSIQGIMLSIPGVLFAFDSFIGVGSWSNEVKGGNKTVSKVIVLAMIIVTIVYSLVCLASIFHYNSGDNEGTTIVNVLIDSLPESAKKGLTIFVSFFVFISAFGTSNSICGTMINEFRNIIINKNFFISLWFSRRFNEKKANYYFCASVLTFWILVLFIPGLITKNDGIIDGFSNICVVYSFMIYAYLIFLFWRNIYCNDQTFWKNSKEKKAYAALVWISIFLVISVVFLNIFFLIFETAKEWNGIFKSWGLYLSSGGIKTRNIDALVCYILFSLVFFGTPSINDFFMKRTFKMQLA